MRSLAVFFMFVLFVPVSNADEIQVRGLTLGLPFDQSGNDKGGSDGSVGFTVLNLDYTKNRNTFYSLSIAMSFISDIDGKKSARDVSSLPAGNFDSEYDFVKISGGWTLNSKRFDNIIFLVGGEIAFGSTFATAEDGSLFKVGDSRVGLKAGLLGSVQDYFLAGTFSTTTKSLEVTLGKAF